MFIVGLCHDALIEHVSDSRSHIISRLFGESDCGNFGGCEWLPPFNITRNQRNEAARQHLGLAGTGARPYQQIARRQDGGPLLRTEDDRAVLHESKIGLR